jgi:hypothetical protein
MTMEERRSPQESNMQNFSFIVNVSKVNGQIQVEPLTNTIPASGLEPGDGVALTVCAETPLANPTIQTVQFFAIENGLPTTMEAIWARIGQTEGIFTTSGLIFAAMQASDTPTTATFTNVNISQLAQDAVFTFGGLVQENTVTHSWSLDPEVILRSGEWNPES